MASRFWFLSGLIAVCSGLFVLQTPAKAATPNIYRGTYVHLFEWKWNDIALECENFLGPKGFGAVQISPPNDHAVLEGQPWYQRYQPVSYKIISRSGTREELIDMIRRCKAVGVDIYADAVINHMAWVNRSGKIKYGISGSSYDEYKHPGLFEPWDFHRCGRQVPGQPLDNISNYQDRWEVQNCNIDRCADLDTGSEYVRGKLVNYLNDLLDLGIAGFRIDAAKHIPSEHLQAILSGINRPAYVFQEVMDPRSEPIKSHEYFSTGDVTEFEYTRGLARMFYNGKLTWLSSFGEGWAFIDKNKAVVFVDNHDKQRGHAGGGEVITHKDPETYVLANVFMLAWPYGYPQVMSSYRFDSGKQGPPAYQDGETKPVWVDGVPKCGEEWVCEHRWEPIANMVEFRNITALETNVTNWWSNGENQIAFGRGSKGFVVINREWNWLNRKLQTSMPEGRYCDVISGSFKKGKCIGRTVSVNKYGETEISVAPQRALAIHAGAKLN